jgi:antitoxin component of RelBE/YafQ-DinJ toxin-antitoxin module
MTETPRRTIRIPDEVWIPAKRLADHLGLSISQVIRLGLESWVKKRATGRDCHDDPPESQ